MVLATRCPHCRTTFRVVQDQLKLRGGLVRCGACKEIFNGVENLLRPTQSLQERPEKEAGQQAPERPAAASDASADAVAMHGVSQAGKTDEAAAPPDTGPD